MRVLVCKMCKVVLCCEELIIFNWLCEGLIVIFGKFFYIIMMDSDVESVKVLWGNRISVFMYVWFMRMVYR